MENWKEYKLEEICVANSNSYSANDNYEFVNYLDTGSLTENNITEIQKIDLTVEDLPSRAKRKVSENSILYSTVRPNQKHFGIIKNIPANFLVSTGFAVLDVIKEKANPYFLYYFLSQEEITTSLHAIAEQSTSAYPSIKPSDILNLNINLPPLATQQKIAAILSSLDDKIELNNKINDNLEQQAQAIFKSWFVDFEPFGGKMPEDWNEEKVGALPIYITDYVSNGSFADLKKNVQLYNYSNYAYFIRNTDLKVNTFNTFVDEHSYNFLEKSKLFGQEIIISNVGDVGSVFFCPVLEKPMTLGNNIIMLRCDNYVYRYYLYMWFKYFEGKNRIKGITGGSVLQKFNKTDFKNMFIMKPTIKVLEDFTNIISPYFNSIRNNTEENKKIITLRDTLLPKLMSGELDVDKIEL